MIDLIESCRGLRISALFDLAQNICGKPSDINAFPSPAPGTIPLRFVLVALKSLLKREPSRLCVPPIRLLREPLSLGCLRQFNIVPDNIVKSGLGRFFFLFVVTAGIKIIYHLVPVNHLILRLGFGVTF